MTYVMIEVRLVVSLQEMAESVGDHMSVDSIFSVFLPVFNQTSKNLRVEGKFISARSLVSFVQDVAEVDVWVSFLACLDHISANIHGLNLFLPLVVSPGVP